MCQSELKCLLPRKIQSQERERSHLILSDLLLPRTNVDHWEALYIHSYIGDLWSHDIDLKLLYINNLYIYIYSIFLCLWYAISLSVFQRSNTRPAEYHEGSGTLLETTPWAFNALMEESDAVRRTSVGSR